MWLFQEKHGVSALQNEAAWSRGHRSVTAFQEAAAKVCTARIIQRLKDSSFVGLMLDESLDIAVQKKLVIFFKLVVDGVPYIQFGGNVEVQNGKALTIMTAVRTLLTDLEVPLAKVIGLGTDGAAVMTGSNNGFTTSFKRQPIDCECLVLRPQAFACVPLGWSGCRSSSESTGNHGAHLQVLQILCQPVE